MELDQDRLLRELRQRLESLRRAGLQAIPWTEVVIAQTEASVPSPAAPTIVANAPTAVPAHAVPAPQPRPTEPPRLVPKSLFGDEGFTQPTLDRTERITRLGDLRQQVATCQRCPQLAATRTQTVFGVGDPQARLMFIGEAPGADEDRLGEPFVGRAGQLLNDMITKGMGLTRAEVYIANILKSRPPENRDPQPPEIQNCLPYLEQQIEIIRPEFLCLLGRIAAQTLLDTAMPMSRLRSRWHRYRGIAAIATYHPAYLLRNPAAKKEAWEDLQMLMKAMGLSVPKRGRRDSDGNQ